MGRTEVGYQVACSRLGWNGRLLAWLVLAAASACGGGSSSDDAPGAGGVSGANSGGSKANGGKSNASGGTAAGVGGADTGEGGAPTEAGSGGSAFGGREGFGGRDGAGGSGFVPLGGFPSGGSANGGRGHGGASSGGASSGGRGSAGESTGGVNGCVEGAPCTCATLTGVTQCTALGSSCSCPPAEQCKPFDTTTPCFDPCGGDPFGSWVLVDSCFRGGDSEFGCARSLVGTPGASDIRIRILDGGEVEMAGTESWSVEAKATVACLGIKSVNSCRNEKLYVEPTLFSSFSRLDCAANACGLCDCKGSAESPSANETTSWSRQGNTLTLGGRLVPYCVKGEELWLGGGNANGEPKAAYKFKKRSCVGKPLPCSARTLSQCSLDQGCTVGVCKATGGGPSPRCAMAYSEDQCGVLQGCTWDASGCSGSGLPQCDIANCENVPGCSWGDPVERCGGEAWECSARNPTQDECLGGGCSLTNCQPNQTETVDCKRLTTADCMKATGCSVSSESTGSVCTGVARCTAQTDLNICSKLDCQVFPACAGVTAQCANLTLATCHDVPGCRLEW